MLCNGLTAAMCCGRIGNIIFNGSIGNASLVVSGVATVYLLGLQNVAQVNLAGTASLFIEPASGVCRPLPTSTPGGLWCMQVAIDNCKSGNVSLQT